jgi:LacI family transcriptional regulator
MAILRNPPNETPTLIDVAHFAGVGLGTASRALSGQGYVKEATAERIRKVAEDLGYQRNDVARSLKVRRSGAVGIVIPDVGGPFMASCVRGAQKILRSRNYISMIAFTDGDEEIEKQEIDYLIRRQIDGLIVVPSASGAAHFQSRQIERIPVVAFDQPIVNTGFDSVLVKNRTGARNAVEHLIEHGHKRIACLGVHRHLYSIQRRIEGYREAMKHAKLKSMLEIVDPADDGIAKQIDKWLKLKSPPTAIFSLNELSSIGVVETLAARQIRMPDQMAFISFDEIQLGKYLNPPVTAVVQPGMEIGSRAASRLLERMEAGSNLSSERILLDTQLILRGSCGCSDTH